ncbi:MAG: 40S ribosomal protein S3a/S1 [Nanoarchaeota archaeon]|nr:40S ribosomal protein S3a/S1 [Nanoarchaeota archaeon]
MAERKKFIEAQIPILNEGLRVLGTPEELDQKTIKLDLTRQLRGKGLTVTFRLFNQEGKLVGIPNKMELVTSYIRRMMRKRSDYVEDSFKAQCADIRVIIKPLLITRKRVSRAVRRNLRNTAREFLLEYLKEKDFNEVCEELLEGSLQKTLLPKLKKIYPLSFCDIRVFETKEIKKIDLKKASERKIESQVEGMEPTEESTEEAEEIAEEEKPVKKEVKKEIVEEKE